MARLAQRENRHTPVERRCIASGQLLPKAELIRFVVDPEGCLVPDLAGRLPGRGLWLLPCRDVLNKAARRNLFAKAAKAPVKLPPDLGGLVEKLLARRCVDLIGLGRRAGDVVAGFEKVRAALRGGTVGLLLQAADAAEDGRSKLQALAAAQRTAAGRGEPVAVSELLTAAELGQALGGGERVHVALAPGPVAERLKTEIKRLAGLRGSVAEKPRGSLDEGFRDGVQR